MTNQENSFPQSAQEANEEALPQKPSSTQENLPTLDEEQLEAVVGAGAALRKCCSAVENRVLGGGGPSTKDLRKADDALINQWQKEHNTAEKMASPSWNIGRSPSGGSLVKMSPNYSYTGQYTGPKVKQD